MESWAKVWNMDFHVLIDAYTKLIEIRYVGSCMRTEKNDCWVEMYLHHTQNIGRINAKQWFAAAIGFI